MAWLRIDDSFAIHPKIASLSDQNFRVWVRVLCHCSRFEDPTVDDSTIKEVQGLTKHRVERFVELGLLDSSGKTHEVHDWAKYQPADKTGAERQARWRARRNGRVTVSVTPPLTVVRAHARPTRPEEKKPTPSGVSSSSLRSEETDAAAPAPDGGAADSSDINLDSKTAPQFDCPHCDQIFPTWSERQIHLELDHANQPEGGE